MFDWLIGRKNKKLPLLECVSKQYLAVRLDDVVLIACQHLLGTTQDMFEILFQHGLKPENTYLLGKCYSTNETVYRNLQKRGVHVSPLSKAYDSQLTFDEQFQLHVEQFIGEVKQTNKLTRNQPVILLDDGAELMLYANDFFRGHTNVRGVEQTSSGYQRLMGVALNFPVINIARSSVKLSIESPMIAEVAMTKLEQRLEGLGNRKLKILVVGQGPIGQSFAQRLAENYEVDTYDLSSHGNRFPGTYSEKLHQIDVIVGATGQSIIQPGEFGKLKEGVILASISSSDREFSAAYLRRLVAKTTNCHQDIKVNGITLLNSGFPINFDGSLHSVPPEKIQLTRALLLAGVFMASEAENNKGLNSLNPEVEKVLMQEFRKINHANS